MTHDSASTRESEMVITKAEAIARLTRRWEEQAALSYPWRMDTPLEMYLAMNWRVVAANGMMTAYASEPTQKIA